MKNSLFIIASPFQALCMLAIVEEYNICKYDVLIQYCDDFSVSMIENLLKEKNIQYKAKRVAHAIKDVFKVLRETKNKYNRIFIGDYYALSSYGIAVLISHFNAKISFFDDGTQALEIFSDMPRKRFNNWKQTLLYDIYSTIRAFKLVSDNTFFSIYPVRSKCYKIQHYSFNSIFTNELRKRRSGIYIIGTNSSVLEFRNKKYIDYLESLIEYLRKRYPEEYIWYCPHRRDINNKKISVFCGARHVKIFNTQVSVEYDFSKYNINPVGVYGFTSNALFTLKSIYQEAVVETVFYQLCDRRANKETELIREKMQSFGIRSLKLI